MSKDMISNTLVSFSAKIDAANRTSSPPAGTIQEPAHADRRHESQTTQDLGEVFELAMQFQMGPFQIIIMDQDHRMEMETELQDGCFSL
jgi:hypothetical protein